MILYKGINFYSEIQRQSKHVKLNALNKFGNYFKKIITLLKIFLKNLFLRINSIQN